MDEDEEDEEDSEAERKRKKLRKKKRREKRKRAAEADATFSDELEDLEYVPRDSNSKVCHDHKPDYTSNPLHRTHNPHLDQVQAIKTGPWQPVHGGGIGRRNLQ